MRKSQRPITVRVSSNKSGRSAALKSKPARSKDFYLPEDEDEAPRSRTKTKKKRSKDDFIENTHEAMQQELEQLLESETNGKKVSSKFKKSFEKFQSKFDPNNPDFRVDQASNSFSRSALDMLIDLIPLAEEAFRTTKKESASYALVALVKQVEELHNSLRMSEDIEGRISVIRSLIQTAFVRLADMIIRTKFDMHKSIDAIVSDSKKRKHLRTSLDEMILDIGKPMEEYKEHLQMQIGLFMLGDPSYLNPEAAKQQATPKKKKRKMKK